MKEKVESILGGFLERNKDYAVELYIDNAVTNKRIGQTFITMDRTFKADDDKFSIKWDISQDINFNKFSLAYDEILACYEETDKYNQQTVYVIFKNGIEFIFECIGMQI